MDDTLMVMQELMPQYFDGIWDKFGRQNSGKTISVQTKSFEKMT
jgi:hypothetical protein